MRYINQFSSCVFLRVFSFFILLFSSLNASADTSYQFALGGDLSTTRYDIRGEAEGYSFYGSAYINPVVLDGALPYDAAAFFQRIASISASVNKLDADEFLRVRGGRILTNYDGQQETLWLKLADPHSSLSLELGYFQSELNYYFSDGSSAHGEDKDNYVVMPSWFVTDRINLYGLYVSNESKVYGLGVKGLHNIGVSSFMDYGVQIEQIKEDRVDLNIVNGTVRNLDIQPIYDRIYTLRLGYYPDVSHHVSLLFKYQRDEYDISKTRYGVSYRHHITPMHSLTFSYLRVEGNSAAKRMGLSEYKDLTLGINYRF